MLMLHPVRLVLAITVLSLTLGQTLAQVESTSPALNNALAAEIDGLFAAWNKPGSPGCLLGVLREGSLVYERGYGMANLDYDIPISSQSAFPIASLSKQFTAACIALLAEEGRIALEDDMRRYLPEMPDHGRRIELQHLLHHTSGIRDYGNELLSLPGVGSGENLSDADVLQLLARQKNLHYLPGDAFRYSNSGYFLLGLIVERVSSMSLRAFANERLFQPLGMTNTYFQDDFDEVVKQRVIGYFSDREGSFQIRMPRNGTGDGGVMTTLHDLVLWEQAATSGRVGKPDFFNRLLTTGKLNSGEPLTYASGLNLAEYRGRKTVWHTGAFPGFRTALVRFPAQRLAVIILANVGGPKGMNAYQLAQRVADLCLGDSLKPAEQRPELKTDPTFVELSAADFEGKAGDFLDADGAPWVISTKDGALGVKIGLFGVQTTSTGALSPTRFKSISSPFRFELEFTSREDGTPGVRVYPEGGKPYWLKSVELVSLTVEMLKEYVGSYHSEELDTTYRMVSKEGNLWLACPRSPHNLLAASVRDTFKARLRGGNLQIKFVRDDQGRIHAFDLSQAGGARDIRFVRRAE